MAAITTTTSPGVDLPSAEGLPYWADISSLSDEELFALYDACELRFPQPSYIKCTSVRRIASDVVMKAEGAMEDSEALAMSLVRASTTIPVPAVRRAFTAGARKGFVMDYIPGRTVSECWGRLGLWRRFRVLWAVRGYRHGAR